MTNGDSTLRLLTSLDEPRGPATVALDAGCWAIRLEGLPEAIAASLVGRWRGFAARDPDGPADVTIRYVRGARDLWIPHWAPGDRYRIEGTAASGRIVVRSYHFALCPEDEPARWRVAVEEADDEPPERIAENAVRYIVARTAVDAGGVCLHGGGVLRGGRAYVFAGPSRSGKTTAIELSRPSPSLGDDLSVLVPGADGWRSPALPFQSDERAPERPPGGPFPVAGIWRLFQGPEPRVETLPPALAAASLLGCAAFVWAMPDRAGAVMENVRRFVRESRFAHLHLRRSPDFWPLIEGGGTEG